MPLIIYRKVHGVFTNPSYRGVKLGAIACAGTITGFTKSGVSGINPPKCYFRGQTGELRIHTRSGDV
jgi:hypothetical protein